MPQQALTRVLRNFARTMAGSYDTTEVLHDLSESAVEVCGATAAGVALLDGDDLRFITATNTLGAEGEKAQERFQSGPCLESVHKNRPVAIADISECHDRWPDYAAEVEGIGIRAILGLPLVLDDRQVGSLDVYSTEVRSWDDDVIEAGRTLADIAAAFLLNASELAESQRTAHQLQTALDSRIVIEQAKGILAERHGMSPEEVFRRIRDYSRSHNERVSAVCRRVIDAGFDLS